MSNKKLSWGSIIAFGMPSMPMAMIFTPLFAIVPALYQEHTTVTLAQIGVVLIVARLFDTITDPLIGFLSDHTTSRFGSRKPWIAAGGLISLVSVYFLYSPTPDVGVYYYMTWSLLAYLGWTMIEIPRNAWLVELTTISNERTKLISSTVIMNEIGGIIFYLLPFLSIFSTTRVTLEVIKFSVWIILPLLLVSLIVNILSCSTGENQGIKETTLKGDFKSILTNKPFLMLCTALILIGLGVSSHISLLFIFIDGYLEIGERYSEFMLLMIPAGLIVTPFWAWVMTTFEKHKAWAIGGGIYAFTQMQVVFLEPGPQSFIPFAVIGVVGVIGLSAGNIASTSLMTDIIDYDTFKTGANRSAAYFSYFALIQKFVIAIGGGIGLIVAGFSGYEVGIENTQSAKQTLLFLVGILPSLFYFIAFYCIWKFPINSKRRAIIQKRIHQRLERNKLEQQLRKPSET